MLRIGLTGGIGSGKSTVAELFNRHGVPVIDADEIARALVEPAQPAHQQLIDLFGDDILGADGHLDRARLRQRVFDNPRERRALEGLLHPLVRREIQRQLDTLEAPYCVIVVPLLIESGQYELVDRILVIDTDEALQTARVAARSGLNTDEVKKIIAAQMGRTERLGHADDVIGNTRDLKHLALEVERLHRYYLALAGRRDA